MRHSTLLLATYFALHASVSHVAEATSAASKTNQDHSFLQIKNDIRRQRFLRSNDSSDHDERMLAWDPLLLSSKSRAEIFKQIRERADGTSDIDKVQSVLQTMETKEMEQVLAAFKEKDKLEKDVPLVDHFIDHWGIDAVAMVLVQAKASGDPKVLQNGDMLLKNLMESFDNKAHGDYDKVFSQLEIDAVGTKRFAGRVELLDDYIKYKSEGQPNDVALFKTLSRGLGSYANLAHVIGLTKAVDMSAEALETRFVKHFVDLGYDAPSFSKVVIFPKSLKDGLRQHQFEMVEKHFDLDNTVEMMIPDAVLNIFIEGFGGEGKLAVAFSLAVERPDFDGAKKYEELLFDHLMHKHIGPNNIDFVDSELAAARVVKERYRKWSAEHKKRKRKWFAEVEPIISERKQKRTTEHGNIL